jgi:uncharacterized protein YegL
MSLEHQIDIANPQHPHCPSVLLLDTSASMAGAKLTQLVQGLQFFRDEVEAHELARKRVDVAVVTFGEEVRVVQSFTSVAQLELPELQASGRTPMGAAILTAIDLVERRKEEYRAQAVDYYRPWIFLITDGEPTDMHPGDPTWDSVVAAVHEGERLQHFLFFTVGVDSADLDKLRLISPPDRQPLKLRPGHFQEMFAWVANSQQQISMSRVGEQISVEDPTAEGGWAKIET